MIALLLAAALSSQPAALAMPRPLLPPAPSCLHAAVVHRGPGMLGGLTFTCVGSQLQPAPVTREVSPIAPPSVDHMPNVFRQPAYCPSIVEREVARQHAVLRSSETPLQYAVFRQLDGCMVPAPVGYHYRSSSPAPDPAAKPEGAPAGKH